MAKQTIECPRCHGKVGLSWRGQTLEDALARHEHLTHAVIKDKPPAAEVATPVPTKRRVVRSPRRPG